MTRKSLRLSTVTCCQSLRYDIGSMIKLLCSHQSHVLLSLLVIALYKTFFCSTQMTRLVLPGMVERYSYPIQGIQSKDKWWWYWYHLSSHLYRGTGLIINMSSEAGVHPQPLLSLYSSTKVFSPPDITFISAQTLIQTSPQHYRSTPLLCFSYFRGLCYASQSACMLNTSQKE